MIHFQNSPLSRGARLGGVVWTFGFLPNDLRLLAPIECPTRDTRRVGRVILDIPLVVYRLQYSPPSLSSISFCTERDMREARTELRDRKIPIRCHITSHDLVGSGIKIVSVARTNNFKTSWRAYGKHTAITWDKSARVMLSIASSHY